MNRFKKEIFYRVRTDGARLEVARKSEKLIFKFWKINFFSSHLFICRKKRR